MLTEWPTRCTLPVQDLERARAFYERILGLVAIEEFPDGGINYNAGGTRITLFPSGTPRSGNHSQLGFDVQDIRTVINSLESKGVRFEDYDMPGFATEGHLVNIAPYNCAWFKDSEGNSLAIWEPDSAPSGTGILMFSDCTTEANLPVDDMMRARRFYEETLGFKALEVFADGGVAYESGPTQFLVSPTTVTPSREHTLIAFDVQDIRAEMRSLEAVGVKFEDQSVGPPMLASFKDSEGNRLSLVEGIRTPAVSGA
jgi:predicted enzyme related to lactoylglutathione lyase